MKPDFISYLKTLKPEDWGKKVNDKWTIKDVVTHMVGWEKGDPGVIRLAWETKEKPWFVDNKKEDDDIFNKKTLEYYKDYAPDQLIKEWEKRQKEVRDVIDDIGEDNLRQYPKLFGWLFNEGKDSHYNFHYQQIKNIVEKK